MGGEPDRNCPAPSETLTPRRSHRVQHRERISRQLLNRITAGRQRIGHAVSASRNTRLAPAVSANVRTRIGKCHICSTRAKPADRKHTRPISEHLPRSAAADELSQVRDHAESATTGRLKATEPDLANGWRRNRAPGRSSYRTAATANPYCSDQGGSASAERQFWRAEISSVVF
jgi:hypothetical protein